MNCWHPGTRQRDPDESERMSARAVVGGDRRPHFVRCSLNSLLMAIMAISELVVVEEARLQLHSPCVSVPVNQR